MTQQGMNKWKPPLFSGVQRALDSRFVVPLNSMIHRQALYIIYFRFCSLSLLEESRYIEIYMNNHEHTLIYMNTHEHVTISYPDMFVYIHVM